MPKGGARAAGAARTTGKQARQLARRTARLYRDEALHVQPHVRDLTRARVAALTQDQPAKEEPSDLERRALLIINAKSGRGANSISRVREIADTLAAVGINVDVRVKLKKSIAARHAREAAQDGYRLVIAAGGDGTVAAVARGLVGTDATLGIVPLGTYNNTATSLGIPTDVREACALIASGVERPIDVGEVRATGKRKPRIFLEMGAVGLAAALTVVGQHVEKGRIDAARELLPLALSLQPTAALVRLDKASPALQTRTMLILMANGPRTGAGLQAAPYARMDDGILDVHVYEDADHATLLAGFVAALGDATAVASSGMRVQARKVRVETAFPMPVLADSKVVGTTPATFRIRAGALRVIAGDGPGLARPAADTTMLAVRELAHVLTPGQNGQVPGELGPRDAAVHALAQVVPTVASAVERARSVRGDVLPLAGALIGGALLATFLRRMRV